MNWQISKPVRQLSAVSLLVATLAALMLLVILPFHQHHTALNAQIEQERLVLALLSQPQTNSSQSQNIAQSVSTQQLEPLVLAGENDTIRLANLQSTLGPQLP
jgi:hypothetical protein